ncbi:MAG: type II toxin-antitoxin system MqsA family antitoxin [Gemmataceae bacterium]|nr:type II toxin-antitoxin system MqsA family antitoxin [Gemmataceae bacterium]
MSTEQPKAPKRCSICGHSPLRETTITDRFEYGAEGETPLTIEAHDVPVEVCDKCGERYLGPAAARAHHLAVCRAVGLMTPDEVRSLRERFGPTQAEFARLTGIGEATISRWERGRLLPSRALDRYLRLLDRHSENVAFLRELNGQDASGKVELPAPAAPVPMGA